MSKNNVLIITTSGDQSTNDVIDWIEYFNYTPIRINTDELYTDTDILLSLRYGINNEDYKLQIRNVEITSNMIKSVWYRKFDIPNFNIIYENLLDYGNLKKHLISEYFASMFSIFQIWSQNVPTLGYRIVNQPSKMEMLMKAKKCGLDIPDTILTNTKNDLIEFFHNYDQIITKAVRSGNLFYNSEKSRSGMIFTEVIDKTKLSKVSNLFYYSLFQEALEKDYEIRVFYLAGKCYSMAIFSQLDEQTNVDFRMYNNSKENRVSPYSLPNSISDKITKFMNLMDLDTGSIDIIKTKDNRYVFLEVNPWGQYDMVSEPCNYNLSKKIAKHLIS